MWALLDLDPPIYASSLAGMTSVCHHIQLFIEMGPCKPSAWACLESWSSWVARITASRPS
jgi:hypothetical protein